MALVVQKYGGSSLASPELIQRAARRIRDLKASGVDVVVVVSAMGRTTDYLHRLAYRTSAYPSQRELDMLLTAGERISMSLVAMALSDLGVPAISFTGSQSGIVTTHHHTEARILEVRPDRIRSELAKGKVAIVAGFQGVSSQKEVTTLGRGGSDTSAVALAAVLGAERCEILTDVDGLYTADPRIVSEAKLITHCTYGMAFELARLGAKMQSRSIRLAERYRVAVQVLNSSLDGTGSQVGLGTLIEVGGDSMMENAQIRGITSKGGQVLFRTESPISEVARVLSRSGMPLRYFCIQGSVMEFFVESEEASRVQRLLCDSAVEATQGCRAGLVSVVGEGLTSDPDILAETLEALNHGKVNPIWVTVNGLSISVAVRQEEIAPLVRRLHQQFIEEETGATVLARSASPGHSQVSA